MKKALLFAIPLSLMVAFSACKKDKKTDEKEEDKTAAALVVKKEQRGFMGYVGATWCPPCGAYGGPGFKAIKNAYSNNEVIPLYFAPSGETVAYSHDGSKVVVAGFATDFNAALKSSGTIPYYNINGTNEGGAYTTTSGTTNKYKPLLDNMMAEEASIGLAARKTIEGNKISCEVKMQSYKDLPANLYYSVLVLENSVKGTQKITGAPTKSDYEHINVTRASLIGDGTMQGQKAWEAVSASAITTNQEFSKTFSLNYENFDIGTAAIVKWNLNPANTTVVVTVWRKIGTVYNYVNGVVAE